MTRAKQISISLHKAQIEFLRGLIERIERQSHKKISRSKITKVLIETLTCIKKIDIHECRSEREIEKELLKCLKKYIKKREKYEKLGKAKRLH